MMNQLGSAIGSKPDQFAVVQENPIDVGNPMEGFNHLRKWKTVLSIHRNSQGIGDPVEGEMLKWEGGARCIVPAVVLSLLSIIDTSFAVKQSTARDQWQPDAWIQAFKWLLQGDYPVRQAKKQILR